MEQAPTPQFLRTDQIQTFFQGAAITALGYKPTNDDGWFKVRVSWPVEGQPDWTPADDIVFVRCTIADDEYDRLREVKDYPNDELTIIRATFYTRVWRVEWVIYGPNSADIARRLVSSLFRDESHDACAANNLYLVTDIPTPQRVPELYNRIWWERVDFSTKFNEAVVETETLNTVKSVEIKVYNQFAPDIDHPTVDINVVAPGE